MKEKNIVLFVNSFPATAAESLQRYEKKAKQRLRIAVLYNSKNTSSTKKQELRRNPNIDIALFCDINNQTKLTQTLLPYQDELLAITCRAERHLPYFAKVIPHVPYLRTPTTESLVWATDKIAMRRRLRLVDKKIAPRFTVTTDAKAKTLETIKEKVGFPLVLKPSGLAASLLVTICFHEDELRNALQTTLKKINKVYRDNGYKNKPQILVEEFMDGDMYSIDAYVTSRGTVYACPPVHIKTGYSVGFDDFFGYRQITPTLLNKQSIKDAESVTRTAVHALGLRSTTVHVELMKTEKGFKVIEAGARVGGFRHRLYEMAYNIDHTVNDILIRMPKKPLIFKTAKGTAAALKFYAKKEGTLKKLTGIKKIQELSSIVEINVNKKIGDRCRYAKHGGKSVCDIIVFSKKRSDVLADIRRIEQTLKIITE